MKRFVESEITGTIKSTSFLDVEDIDKLYGEEVFCPYDEQEIKKLIREGELEEDDFETLEGIGRGMFDDLLMDRQSQIMKMITTDGVFFIISQNIDGHSQLNIVRRTK